MKKNQPRIHLAAFGKHPGWEDHIPGIGLETEGLAYVKQTLYVAGIGGQIDAGVWDKSEPEKRCEGFDHWFLWRRAGTIVVGRFWSSSDRVGRKKYPMVLCLESAGVAPETLLTRAWPELERLRQACAAAETADRVEEECRTSQEHLRRVATGLAGSSSGSGLDNETKRGFLQRSELGPDRLGLLRILHELERTIESTGRGPGTQPDSFDTSRSCHLRVPRACDTDGGALLLWQEFFGCALPSAPVLLLARVDTGWLDIVFGEPESSDLFCLQASLKALPLATEIPYELDSELAARLKKLESRFLGQSPATSTIPTSQSPKPETSPYAEKKRETAGRPETTGGGMRWLLAIVILVLVIGIGISVAWWLSNKSEDTSSEPVEATATTQAPTQDLDYQAATNAADSALRGRDFPNAITQADRALALKPNDQVATKLKTDAQAAQSAMVQVEKNYQAAANAANLALGDKDYPRAIDQANLALGFKPGDPVATKLKADAQAAQAAKQEVEKNYQAATNAAGLALREKNYPNAIEQANVALGLKPDDPAATDLRNEAQREQKAITESEMEYQSAITTAGKALLEKNFEEAVRQADLALTIRPGDPGATELKVEAKKLQETTTIQEQYAKALAEARTALGKKDYPKAIQQSDNALRIKPNDADALGLKKQATVDLDLQRARDFIDAGEYENARAIQQSHSGEEAFAGLAKAIEDGESQQSQKTLVELDTELQKLLVKFNVVSADDPYITRPEARRESRLGGRLSSQGADYYLGELKRIETELTTGGWLKQNDREKHLKDLRQAILRAQ